MEKEKWTHLFLSLSYAKLGKYQGNGKTQPHKLVFKVFFQMISPGWSNFIKTSKNTP